MSAETYGLLGTVLTDKEKIRDDTGRTNYENEESDHTGY
jgi:hypothetical protein